MGFANAVKISMAGCQPNAQLSIIWYQISGQYSMARANYGSLIDESWKVNCWAGKREPNFIAQAVKFVQLSRPLSSLYVE